ncbi:hypothetical protein K2X05_14145 [bacterium]|nr:hypothetical protein [bacterium]
MKHLLILITTVAALNLNAQQKADCTQLVRAPNQDQINMIFDVAFKPQALNLMPEAIYSSKVENYVSWKEDQQLNCLANVIHRADVEIKTIKGSEICTNRFVVHRKDVFITGNFVSEYKIRDKKESCLAATTQEQSTIQQCAKANCGVVVKEFTFPDHLDNCKCKYFEETIRVEDQKGKYDGFFLLDTVFAKPAGVESPFSN